MARPSSWLPGRCRESLAAAAARMEQEHATYACAAARVRDSFAAATSVASAVDAVLALLAKERKDA